MDPNLLAAIARIRDATAQFLHLAAEHIQARRLPPRFLLDNAKTDAAQAIARSDHNTMPQRFQAIVDGQNTEARVFHDLVDAGFVENTPEGLETWLAWQGVGLAFLPTGEPFDSFRVAVKDAWARHR